MQVVIRAGDPDESSQSGMTPRNDHQCQVEASTESRRIHAQDPAIVAEEIRRNRARIRAILDALAQRLSPAYLVEQLMDYAGSTEGRETMASLGRAVRDNPLPTVLMGTGLLWLFGTAQRNASQSEHRTAQNVANRGHGPGQRLKASAASIKRAAGTAGQRPTVRGTATGDRISSHSTNSRSAGATMNKARERLSGAAGTTRHQAERLGGMAQSGAQRTRDSMSGLYQERPLLMGGVVLALGAMLGAMIPETRRERAMLGDVSDDLFERAREQGREQIDKAQRVAEAAKQAAQEEARQQTQGNGSGAGQDPSSSDRPHA